MTLMLRAKNAKVRGLNERRDANTVRAAQTSASAKSGSEQAERAREEQEQEPRAKRRSAALPPSHDPRHVSILAPELGVHVGLSHLDVAKLAMPAVTRKFSGVITNEIVYKKLTQARREREHHKPTATQKCAFAAAPSVTS